jgi:opacity protein-like surface antigen
MSHATPNRRLLSFVFIMMLVGVALAADAEAQSFVSPSFGYNFSGDSGCQAATDCEDKNWNLGVSFGALGRFLGFEIEVMWEDDFSGDVADQTSGVLTGMGNLMLAPRISLVQPYGLAGIGLIRTSIEDRVAGTSEDENQIGWTVGGGLIVFLSQHVGLKGDVRYYHAFNALELVGIDLAQDTEIDFGRASFGAIFKF